MKILSLVEDFNEPSFKYSIEEENGDVSIRFKSQAEAEAYLSKLIKKSGIKRIIKTVIIGD